MLVLSRKMNQSIQVGENISVTIVRIKGNVVQLGIEAPREVHVIRTELLQRDARQAAQCEPLSQREGETAPRLHRDTEETSESDNDTPAALLAAC